MYTKYAVSCYVRIVHLLVWSSSDNKPTNPAVFRVADVVVAIVYYLVPKRLNRTNLIRRNIFFWIHTKQRRWLVLLRLVGWLPCTVIVDLLGSVSSGLTNSRRNYCSSNISVESTSLNYRGPSAQSISGVEKTKIISESASH